jgi:hypothetical protein
MELVVPADLLDLHDFFMYRHDVAAMLSDMTRHFRTLLVEFSALMALGTLSACSSGSSSESSSATPSPTTVKLSRGSLTSRINGRDVTASRVSGTTRFG